MIKWTFAAITVVSAVAFLEQYDERIAMSLVILLLLGFAITVAGGKFGANLQNLIGK